MKQVLIIILLTLPIRLLAQELCDNGLDDDGDGLIDLNDTADCRCMGIHEGVTSLIPNPSFEDTLCCPTELAQLDCAEIWMQASLPTTDYFNVCGITGLTGFVPPPPFPLPGNGMGYAGFYDYSGWQEMLGACLTTPMQADSSYRISMFVAGGLAAEADPLVVSIYGTSDCGDLPWPGFGCPIGFGGWQLLGSDTVEFVDSSWQQVIIELAPTADIYAMAIGGPCGFAGSSFFENYYYIDELTVASTAASDRNIEVTETGKWCSNDLELHAHIDTVGGGWQWYQNGVALLGETSDSLKLISYGMDAVYTAVYTLDGSCVTIDYTVDTTDPGNGLPLELLILNQDTVVCEGAVIPIRALGTAGAQYQWYPTLGVSNPNALNPDIEAVSDTSILYTLTASFPGCPEDSSQSLTIEVDRPYQVSFKVEPEIICVGQPVYLYPGLSGNVEGLYWAFSGQKQGEQYRQNVYQHAFEQAGVYPITLYSNFRACPDTSYTDSITVYPLPEVDLGGDSSICLYGSPLYLKNLRSAPLAPYRQVWNTGDTAATLKVVHPGIYTLSVTTEPVGCTTTESILISRDCYLDVPNAFTPNGDGQNDYFFPRQLQSKSVRRFQMRVFNRWGLLVFETSRVDGRGWDGRVNNASQPMGVYLYQIEADFASGHKEKYKGNVTLLR